MKKALVSVTGADSVGIIAKVSTALYEMNVNIMDISQTILSGCFTMLMIVDITETEKSFTDITKDLEQLGTKIGVMITVQRMDIFDVMHRI